VNRDFKLNKPINSIQYTKQQKRTGKKLLKSKKYNTRYFHMYVLYKYLNTSPYIWPATCFIESIVFMHNLNNKHLYKRKTWKGKIIKNC